MLDLTVLAVAGIWVLSGVLPALVVMRRGHHSFYWVVLGAGLGPFTVPVLWERMEDDRSTAHELAPGQPLRSSGLKVVVAIDGSEPSLAAARWAATHPTSTASSVTLATVVDFDADDSMHERAAARLDQLAAEWPQASPRLVVLTGKPLDALVGLILDDAVDVMVVGPRGTGLRRSLLGSVTEGLVAQRRCPVLVVPEPS